MKRPHLIVFNPDQWRGDVLGHAGNPGAHTPVLDEWVRSEAVSFTRAFCQNPVCTPSRCSFMTGRYPHVNGHRSMVHMVHPEHGEPSLPQRLREEGYFLWWAGKNDLYPAQHGMDSFCDRYFDTPDTSREDLLRWGYTDQDLRPEYCVRPIREWRGEPGSDTYYSFFHGPHPTLNDNLHPDRDVRLVRGAQEFLRDYADGRGPAAGKPLFLNLCLNHPHVPYEVEQCMYDRINPDALPPRIPPPVGTEPCLRTHTREGQGMQGWTEDRWTALRRTYYAQCARQDRLFGELIQTLKDIGIYGESLVVLLSDHGDYTGDYGLVEKTQNTFEDCLTRVPLLMKPPAGTECIPGTRDALVELVDFTASVYDLLNIDPGYTHFGKSLRPLLYDQTSPHRDAVFCEGGRLLEESHTRQDQRNASPNPESLYYPRQACQIDDGPDHGKGVMCRTPDYKYIKRMAEPDELFDLKQDPHELHNVAEAPEYCGILHDMERRMLQWFLETGDAVPFAHDQR